MRTAPIVCPEGSPLVRPQAQDFFPAGGLTRRLRRGSRACSPMGRSHFSFVGERKVCKRKPAARRLQRRPAPLSRNSQISAFRALPCPALVFAQACQSLTAFGSCAHWAHAPSRPKLRSAVAPLGLSSSTGCPVSHSSLLVALLASHPPCGSLWAAPKAPLGPRFPSGQFATLTRREKGLLLPIFGGGSSQCRAQCIVGQLPPATLERARARLFSAVKIGEAFFPSLPIAALFRRRSALGKLKRRCLGCFGATGMIAQRGKQA